MASISGLFQSECISKTEMEQRTRADLRAVSHEKQKFVRDVLLRGKSHGNNDSDVGG